MKKRILAGIVAAFLTFSLPPRAYAVTQTYDTDDGYVVFTIDKDAAEIVTINCDDVAATLINQTREPGQIAEVKMKLVNQSENSYVFDHAEFYTENRINRNVSGTSPSLPNADEVVRLYCPTDDGAIDGVIGFDHKRIPYSMTVLRCVNRPMQDLYGTDSTIDLTLQQVQDADKTSVGKGYTSYGDYLLHYYRKQCQYGGHSCTEANSLIELHPLHLAEIFGTRSYGYQGQSEIRLPRMISKAELLSSRYDHFRTYGWASQITETAVGDIFAHQDYEIMETDMQMIQAGYQYLYDYGMYFTFDQTTSPLENIEKDEISNIGLSLSDFINQAASAQSNMRKTFSNIVLGSGQTRVLNHIALAVQLPNAYDMRNIDFGFRIILREGNIPPKDSTDPTDSTNPAGATNQEDPISPIDPTDPILPASPLDSEGSMNKIPKMGSHLLYIMGGISIGSGIALIILCYWKRKQMKDKDNKFDQL